MAIELCIPPTQKHAKKILDHVIFEKLIIHCYLYIMCDKQKIYMCTQTFCNNTLNFKGKQNDDIQAKGCFLATELLTSFFLLSKMSENLCKLHRDLDKYYSQNYLSSWCGQVKIGKKHMPLKKLDPFILFLKVTGCIIII